MVNNKALVRAGAPFQLQLGYGKVTRGGGGVMKLKLYTILKTVKCSLENTKNKLT